VAYEAGVRRLRRTPAVNLRGLRIVSFPRYRLSPSGITKANLASLTHFL